jgi:hypothetical protein
VDEETRPGLGRLGREGLAFVEGLHGGAQAAGRAGGGEGEEGVQELGHGFPVGEILDLADLLVAEGLEVSQQGLGKLVFELREGEEVRERLGGDAPDGLSQDVLDQDVEAHGIRLAKAFNHDLGGSWRHGRVLSEEGRVGNRSPYIP